MESLPPSYHFLQSARTSTPQNQDDQSIPASCDECVVWKALPCAGARFDPRLPPESPPPTYRFLQMRMSLQQNKRDQAALNSSDGYAGQRLFWVRRRPLSCVSCWEPSSSYCCFLYTCLFRGITSQPVYHTSHFAGKETAKKLRGARMPLPAAHPVSRLRLARPADLRARPPALNACPARPGSGRTGRARATRASEETVSLCAPTHGCIENGASI